MTCLRIYNLASDFKIENRRRLNQENRHRGNTASTKIRKITKIKNHNKVEKLEKPSEIGNIRNRNDRDAASENRIDTKVSSNKFLILTPSNFSVLNRPSKTTKSVQFLSLTIFNFLTVHRYLKNSQVYVRKTVQFSPFAVEILYSRTVHFREPSISSLSDDQV